jgi:rod shape-determining protein MreC
MRHLADQSMILLTLLVLGVAGVVLDQTHQLEGVQRVALDLVTPVQRASIQAASRIAIILDTARQLNQLQEENRRLRAENDRLTIDNVRMSEVLAENQLLREQLGFKQDNPLLLISSADVIGRVSSRDPNPLLSSLTIDRGAKDGVVAEMPVVTARGLVGRITRVGDSWARVLLLIDPSSSVNALVQRSRATGVVQGQEDGSLLMRYIAQGDDVQPGDIILTSGLGGNFPKGLVIGQVTTVEQRDIAMFKEAWVRPTVDFSRLEIVTVITGFQQVTPGDSETGGQGDRGTQR